VPPKGRDVGALEDIGLAEFRREQQPEKTTHAAERKTPGRRPRRWPGQMCLRASSANSRTQRARM
jgi:hypothetical protein